MRGLPQTDAYETILRDSLATDSLGPAGIYFGTRSGKLYHSRDEGKNWELIKDGLPQVICLRAASVNELGGFAAKRTKAARTPKKAISKQMKKETRK